MRFHFVDSTEPSVLAHEILNAAPYAFLDDGEAIDRRTRAVPLRRGLPVAPERCGAHPGGDRPGSSGDRAGSHHARRTPRPVGRPPLGPCPPEWAELVDVLERRGRVASLTGADGVLRWHTIEASAAVRAVVEGVDVDGTTAEQAAAQVLRGHLEVASPLTHGDLVTSTGLPAGRVTIGLAVLEAEGFAIQGRFSERAVDDGNVDDRHDPASVEWSSRRLLSRMHAYSRAQRRRRVEPVSAEQLMRFLVQWQHVTGARSTAASTGCLG